MKNKQFRYPLKVEAGVSIADAEGIIYNIKRVSPITVESFLIEGTVASYAGTTRDFQQVVYPNKSYKNCYKLRADTNVCTKWESGCFF